MVVRAPPVLALVATLAAYYAAAERLPTLSERWNLAFLSLVLVPALFLLVWLGRDLWRAAPLPLGYAVVLLAAGTVAFELADVATAANFAKFATVALAGWWFLAFFDAVTWVLLVALLIVPVDVFSVARGPTRHIVEEQPEIFQLLSVAFPVPGEEAAAQLGLPDILFFALFLGAAERFGLRPGATWVAMVLSFGATMTLAVFLGVAGLPALPLLSAAFVLVNADLLLRAYRVRRRRGG